MNTDEAIIYLAGCAVNGVTPDQDRLSGLDLDAVYAVASAHLLSACVSIALESAGLRDKRSSMVIADALRKHLMFDAARAQVVRFLNDAGIWYVPLKGDVLKADYPKAFMREMADIDILFDATRAADVKAFMESIGFSTYQFGVGIHDVYHRPPIVSFEMHTALFGPQHPARLRDYYRNVKDRLLPDHGAALRFSPEDFYIYMLAHTYKHFYNDGTGLRSFLDIYVFLNRHQSALNLDYLNAELRKLGIDDFERRARHLAQRLFTDQPLPEDEKEMLHYVLSSSAFGTLQHSAENQVLKQGKLKYFLGRIFLPMSSIQSQYPFFYRHRIFLPLFPLWRFFDVVLFRRENAMTELNLMHTKKRPF